MCKRENLGYHRVRGSSGSIARVAVAMGRLNSPAFEEEQREDIVSLLGRVNADHARIRSLEGVLMEGKLRDVVGEKMA